MNEAKKNMIRYRFYIGMMAAALLLSACSGEEDTALPQEMGGGTQRLAVTTRAAEETMAFDSFNLYLSDYETNTKKEEHLLTWDETENAWLEDGQPCATSLLPAIVNASVCDSPDQITFSSNASNTEFYATYNNIPTDQSTADKLAAAGKPMFVCGRRLNAGEELSLDFLRACTKLVFNVNKDEVIASGGKGELSNIKVTARASSKYYIKSNANSGSWIAGNVGNFSCFYDETDRTITVYTGFTSYYSDQRIMTLDVDGISRRVLMKENLKIAPGNVYTFDLSITPNEVTRAATDATSIPLVLQSVTTE